VPTVLVTGAGRGIGRATALRLANAGWDVVAGVRNAPDGEALAAEGGERIVPVELDVTNGDHVAALPGALPARLEGLVNNAGVVVPGPVEAVPVDELRRQMEVNVIGQAAVTQTVMPQVRAARGRIVFLSSLNGRISTPLTGAYNASKFALEALADSLRVEVRPWGVRVVLVEPGPIDTDIWRGADDTFDQTEANLTPLQRELYRKHLAGYRKVIPLMQRQSVPADDVAEAIEQALIARLPRARYVVGTIPKVQAAMTRFTPTAVLDRLLRAGTGVPSKP
jgi:NAD(P)-dependent dehydrogenase (short-subunit alcohol dehydrogenase family)